ncbi:MAG: EAL domain-containing protein [Gammaproteobacteria bacterium]|nr:EAL domain-containing protein [Gammaproteobacteria bacterium]NIR83717.1 EAL domain-containing protein [Gammaproteobacteria bacterium]NIR91864.1 EAL domain-containing protein [Gammaproteobacteria bacterium]NIU04883.1 EAL domain-containing protein [Gammaproteobacteria bacterium]NIV51865.1 EAL domain-containing protein [Gammaproteobacteria bacterium]
MENAKRIGVERERTDLQTPHRRQPRTETLHEWVPPVATCERTPELLEAILENIDQGVSLVDAELRVVAFNRRFLELLAFPPDRLRPGMPFQAFIRYNAERGEYGPGDVDRLVRERIDLARRFEPHCFERTRPDGTVLEVRGRPLPGGGFVTTYTDITEHKRVQTALRQSEARFRDFAESAADWFWEMDAKLRFTHVSEGLERNTGVEAPQLVRRTRREVFGTYDADAEKWERHEEVLRARRSFEDFEFAVQGPDGNTRMVSVSGKPIFDGNGVFQGYRGAGRDITEAYQLALELSHQATHDPVTGLVNRREFEERLTRALESARRSDAEHALCYLDLDQFKVINDTCGHLAGDELLRQIAALLSERVRRRDTLARLGGDEFGILMEHCPLDDAQHVAEDIRTLIKDFRFVWEHQGFRIGVSIGVAPITGATQSTTSALARADAACYFAKEQGRNRIHVYLEGDAGLERQHSEMCWVGRIQKALDQHRFRLFYQPIVPLTKGRADDEHYEILLRMEDERGRLVSPGYFLPAAERYHLASQLDRWTIDRTFAWLNSHPQHLQRLYLCSINLSGHSLGDDAFHDYLVRRLTCGAVPARKICFEVTETAAISNLASATRLMETLRKLGCNFALDDFGSGVSSFAYLKTLPADFLKIDGAFVRDIADNPLDLAVVKSINEIGKTMGKKTIAEFVDSRAILERLRAGGIGVDYAQGHYLAPARPLENLAC